MTKRIKQVSELPEWFDLKKYEFTRNLNSLGWYEQLYVRTVIDAQADEALESPQFSQPNLSVAFKDAVKAIQEHPDIDVQNEKRLLSHLPFNPVLNRLSAKDPRYMQPFIPYRCVIMWFNHSLLIKTNLSMHSIG